jgi:hypothetical protein
MRKNEGRLFAALQRTRVENLELRRLLHMAGYHETAIGWHNGKRFLIQEVSEDSSRDRA